LIQTAAGYSIWQSVKVDDVAITDHFVEKHAAGRCATSFFKALVRDNVF
jgi:hypothetical protein